MSPAGVVKVDENPIFKFPGLKALGVVNPSPGWGESSTAPFEVPTGWVLCVCCSRIQLRCVLYQMGWM